MNVMFSIRGQEFSHSHELEAMKMLSSINDSDSSVWGGQVMVLRHRRQRYNSVGGSSEHGGASIYRKYRPRDWR